MDNAQIFAMRLKNARLSRSMSMNDLSNALEGLVSSQAIYKYEAGKMLPSSRVIIELSKIFNLPMDYFFRPITTSISGIEFRKKKRLPVKELKAIQAEATELFERYVEISDICNERLPDFMKEGRVVSTKEDVVELVNALRQVWNISESGISNVISFLESIGVVVIEIDTSKDFDGFCGMAEKTPIIVLNKNYTSERKRFTALHELGHLVMNFDRGLSEKEIEKLCHLFAGEMLVSIENMKERLGDISIRRISLQEFADIQIKFGISIDALMHKANDFGMISESRYKSYNILKRTKPAFNEYAVKSRYVEERSDKFEKMVYRAYASNLISGSKASSLLSVPLEVVLERAMFV